MEAEATSTPPLATPRRSNGSGRERKSGSGGTSRLRKSCDPCSLAKRRCDGKPECSLCVKKGLRCIYGERQKSGPKGRKGPAPVPGSTTPRRRAPFVPARESLDLAPEDNGNAISPPRKRTRPATAGHHGVDGESGSESYGEEETQYGASAVARHGTDEVGGGPRGIRGGRVMSRNGVVHDAEGRPMPSAWGMHERFDPHREGSRGGGGGLVSHMQPAAAASQKHSMVRSRETVADERPGAVGPAAGRAGEPNRHPVAGGGHGDRDESRDHDIRVGYDSRDNDVAQHDHERDYHAYPPSKYRRTPGGAWGGRARQEAAEQKLLHQRETRINSLPMRVMRRGSNDGSGDPRVNPDASRSPDRNKASQRVSDGVDTSSPHQRQQQWTAQPAQRRPVSPSHVSRADLRAHGVSGAAGRGSGSFTTVSHDGTGVPPERPWTAGTVGWYARRREEAGGGRGPGAAVGISQASVLPRSTNDAETADSVPRGSGDPGVSPGAAGRAGEYMPPSAARLALAGGRSAGGSCGADPLSAEDAEAEYREAERYRMGGRRAFGGGGPAAPVEVRESNGAYWQYGGPTAPAAPGRYADPEYWAHEGRGYPGWDLERRGEDIRAWGAIEDQGPRGADFAQRRHLLPWSIEKIETMEAMGAGRAGQDKATWDRIATAMMSTVPEAKEQWAMYCDTLRREMWAVKSIAAPLAAGRGDRSGMRPAPPPTSSGAAGGGPPPAWAASTPYMGWRLRADVPPGVYPGIDGARAVRGGPDVDVFNDSTVYGPGRPPAVVGTCAYCGEYWQTNSPAAAGALQAGRWCCPPCESGRRPGPHPVHWEDDEGHTAMARSDVQHHPYYHAEAYEPSAHARRKGWAMDRRPNPRSASRSAQADWEDEMEAAAEAKAEAAAAAAVAANRGPPMSFAGRASAHRASPVGVDQPLPSANTSSGRFGPERRPSPSRPARTSSAGAESSAGIGRVNARVEEDTKITTKNGDDEPIASIGRNKESDDDDVGGRQGRVSRSPVRPEPRRTTAKGINFPVDAEATAALSSIKNIKESQKDDGDDADGGGGGNGARVVKRSRSASKSPKVDKNNQDPAMSNRPSSPMNVEGGVTPKTEKSVDLADKGRSDSRNSREVSASGSAGSKPNARERAASPEASMDRESSLRSAARTQLDATRFSIAGMDLVVDEAVKPWTKEEDNALTKAVEVVAKAQQQRRNESENGTKSVPDLDYLDWGIVAKDSKMHRTPQECRSRWHTFVADLESDASGRWSAEEERTLFSRHKTIGPQWASIAELLPGRTEEEVKKHFLGADDEIRQAHAFTEDTGPDSVTMSPKGSLTSLTSRVVSESPSERASRWTGDDKAPTNRPGPAHDGCKVGVRAHPPQYQHLPFEPRSTGRSSPHPGPALHSERRPHIHIQNHTAAGAISGGDGKGHYFQKPRTSSSSGNGNLNSRQHASTSSSEASDCPLSSAARLSPPPRSTPQPIHNRHSASRSSDHEHNIQDRFLVPPAGEPGARPYEEVGVDSSPAPRGRSRSPRQGSLLLPPHVLPLPPSGTRGFGAGMPHAQFARGRRGYVWSGSGDPPRLGGFGRQVADGEVGGDWAVTHGRQEQQRGSPEVDEADTRRAEHSGVVVGGADAGSEPYGWYGGRTRQRKAISKDRGTEENLSLEDSGGRVKDVVRGTLENRRSGAGNNAVMSQREVPVGVLKASGASGFFGFPQKVEMEMSRCVTDDRSSVDMEVDHPKTPGSIPPQTATSAISSRYGRASPDAVKAADSKLPQKSAAEVNEKREREKTRTGDEEVGRRPSPRQGFVSSGSARGERGSRGQLTRSSLDTQMKKTAMLLGREAAAGDEKRVASTSICNDTPKSGTAGKAPSRSSPPPAGARERSASPGGTKSWPFLMSSSQGSPVFGSGVASTRDPLPMKKRLSPSNSASTSPSSLGRVHGRSSPPSTSSAFLSAAAVGRGDASAVWSRVAKSASPVMDPAAKKTERAGGDIGMDGGGSKGNPKGADDGKKQPVPIAQTTSSSSSSTPSSSFLGGAHKRGGENGSSDGVRPHADAGACNASSPSAGAVAVPTPDTSREG